MVICGVLFLFMVVGCCGSKMTYNKCVMLMALMALICFWSNHVKTDLHPAALHSSYSLTSVGQSPSIPSSSTVTVNCNYLNQCLEGMLTFTCCHARGIELDLPQ